VKKVCNINFCNSKFRIFSSISSSLFSLLSSSSSSSSSLLSLSSRSRSRNTQDTQEKMFVLEWRRESENQEFFNLVGFSKGNRIENFLYKIKKDAGVY